jgi:exosortase/archaeosortase family protein
MTTLPNSVTQRIAAVKTMSNLTVILKTSTIVAVTLAFYLQDLTILFANSLQDEASTYLLAVPFLFLYLIYRKRRMLRAAISIEQTNRQGLARHVATISGILLCATAVVLYWFGSYTFNPLEYHVLTLPVFTAGLVLILFSPRTLRQLAFPIVFLTFLQPLPSSILYGLGSAMSVLTSEASSAIVNVFGISSRISGESGNPIIIITRPDTTMLRFRVDLACSGIFSLLGFVIFAVFIAYIARGSVFKKSVILLLGLPVIILLNITRITIILAIGYHYGEALALQIFHLLGATVLLFLGTLLILVVSDKAFKKPPPVQPCPTCTSAPQNSLEGFCSTCGGLLQYPGTRLRKLDAAKIVALALAVMVLVSIQAPVFALTQGPAQIIIQTPTGERGNTELLPQIEGYTLSFDYRDRDFEQTAKQDASLVYSYKPADTAKELVIAAIEIAPSKSSLHPWETCLVTWPQTHGYQPKVAQLDLKDVQIMQNPPIIARYFAFQYTSTNDTQVVLYWFGTSTFLTNNTAEQKQVKISLIAFPETAQNLAEAENQLLVVAIAIANYWQPIKAWTQIALAISQNGPILATISLLLLFVTLAYQTLLNAREEQSMLKLYNKLPLQNKQLIQAINQTLDEATPSNIAVQLQALTGEPADPAALTNDLLEAEEVGLIQKKIANREDEPVVVWKSQAAPYPRPFLSLFTRRHAH